MLDASVVKVVADARGDALYFSRSPIPSVRLPGGDPRRAAAAAVSQRLARQHVGLYVYRREALARRAALPPSPLERAEGLEQLRALQNGMRIRVVEVQGAAGLAVDTPADLERVRELLASTRSPDMSAQAREES
jgi:3-deoxy-manno-octulosonate cytidylyltransferase (CMP-KDO synthetase)